MSTFRDFLIFYNNLDVKPFVEAIQKMKKIYSEKGVDAFKDAINVPGIARKLLFETSENNNTSFSLFDESNKDLYQTIKQNIVGGPSIVFHRYHSINETLIRNMTKCRNIVGYDANALYLYCLGLDMPVDKFYRRKSSTNFSPEKDNRLFSMYEWLDYLNFTENYDIKHKKKFGSEVLIGPYFADGFDSASNTIFEYHSCWYHGHPCKNNENVKSKYRDLLEKRYQRTLKKQDDIRKANYNYVEIWQCEFEKLIKDSEVLRDFIDKRHPPFQNKFKGKVTNSQILNSVRSGELFGMVEVDIQVPKSWSDEFKAKMSIPPSEYFSEMSPIFCNSQVKFEDVGDHMQEYINTHNQSKKPRRLLIGGMKAKQILIATPLLKWYLEHGLIVTKMYQVVEYKKEKCFLPFCKQVSDARRQGDADSTLTVAAETMKLIGNSAYGSLIMDKTKFTQLKYTNNPNKACLFVNQPNFKKMNELEENLFEVEFVKDSVKLDLPIQLGYFILQYAKLRMLEFYYDFMDVYIDRRHFQYIEMDTDSAYMAISAEKLEDLVKPDLKQRFYNELSQWFPSKHCHVHKFHYMQTKLGDKDFIQPPCCKKQEKYDRITPGLFKLEASGEEMIALSPKTYLLKQKDTCKFSCKGVNKSRVINPERIFKSVLNDKVTNSVTNMGFRVKYSSVFSYHQIRSGFNYFYCKRKILNDGISTIPLDVTLCPVPPGEEIDE